jgi:hypothetical protein
MTASGATAAALAGSETRDFGLDIEGNQIFIAYNLGGNKWTVGFTTTHDSPVSPMARYVLSNSTPPVSIEAVQGQYTYVGMSGGSEASHDDLYNFNWTDDGTSWEDWQSSGEPAPIIGHGLSPTAMPTARALYTSPYQNIQTQYLGELYMNFRVDFPWPSEPYDYPAFFSYYLSPASVKNGQEWIVSLRVLRYGTDEVLYENEVTYDMDIQTPQSSDFTPGAFTDVGAIEWGWRARLKSREDDLVYILPYSSSHYRVGFGSLTIKCRPTLHQQRTVWRFSDPSANIPLWENVTPDSGVAPTKKYGMSQQVSDLAHVSMVGEGPDGNKGLCITYDQASYWGTVQKSDRVEGILRYMASSAVWGEETIWYSPDGGRSLEDRIGDLAAAWGAPQQTIEGALILG